jgi:diaminopimelate decarboxylase
MNAHSTVARYLVRDGMLCVGGVPVDMLAARAGRTPFFAYDRQQVTQRVGLLRQVLPSGLRLSYALKANPFPALVQHLSAIVDHLDVASAGELALALDTTTPSKAISFAGPGKRRSELRQAIAAGVVVELESETEAMRVLAVAEELGRTPTVAIRVNPDFAIRGSGMRMGGGPQQFGVDAERVHDLARMVGVGGADLVGFHVFAGSQNLDAERIMGGQGEIVGLVLRLADEAGLSLRYVNLGGGFGIPYGVQDEPLDVTAIGDNLSQLLTQKLWTVHPNAVPVLELGRYLVGEAGVYITRVLDRKISRGKTFLVVDGGLHHQLAASGNFGTVIRRNYPISMATRMSERVTGRVTVVGCLCTPLDLLGADVDLPDAQVGDLVAVFQAGAYGRSASPSDFLSHPAAHEMLV